MGAIAFPSLFPPIAVFRADDLRDTLFRLGEEGLSSWSWAPP
jgi:hypothetical protein